jgi:dienelactone hydrolase
MPRPWRRATLAALGFVAIVAAMLPLGGPLQGLSLVVRAANLHGAVRSVAELTTTAIVEAPVLIPADGEPLRARVYAPDAPSRLAVLLVTGVHSGGIDEPRLMRLSRELAKARVTVVTPEIPELSSFDIAPIVTDRIEYAAVWLATGSQLSAEGSIGLVGVSFSGGLAVVAAGRPSLRGRLHFVLSVGGHDDLGRVLDYFCGKTGDGRWPPHDYGTAIALLNVADRLVPDSQVKPLRAAVRRFLHASYVARFDDTAATREFQALSAAARALDEPSATLLWYVLTRDVRRLAPLLRPHLRAYAEQPALSPALSPLPSAPVYLLHGRDDAVIPSSESRYLADRLRGRVPVHLLVTGMISHAERDHAAQPLDVARLAAFWGRVLTERSSAERMRDADAAKR